MVRTVVVPMIALGLLVAGCGSDGATPDEDARSADTAGNGAGSETVTTGDDGDEPIKIGEITSYSGVEIFPEAATTARLVFKRYNDQGGLDGRPIQLVSVDAQDSIEGAAAGAERLLEFEEVVGFCCGGSIVDCSANAEFYAENGVEALPAAAACAEAPTVHPLNVGPWLPSLHMLDYLATDLGHEDVCYASYEHPVLDQYFDTQVLPAWEASNGQSVTLLRVPGGTDMAPLVDRMTTEGCGAVLAGFSEQNYVPFFTLVGEAGLRDEIDFATLAPGYSLSLIDSLGEQMDGVYVSSEFEPFTGDEAARSDDVQAYLDLITSVGMQPTSLGQSGYLAANIMISALESIEGEITFESVQEAVRAVTYETEMLGDPFATVGYTEGLQPNRSTQVLRVDGLGIEPVGGDWRTFTFEASGQ